MSENKKLFIFLSTHLIIWTLIPAISNHNLPLDTIEALAWGSNLDWGFNKHPPMSAFAVEVFYQIFGSLDWAYYLLSQIFVVSSFYIIYIFAKDFLKNKNHAIISILLLESIFFYNFTTPEFNVNVCQLPFWALSIHYAWKCAENEKLKDYALLGLFVGLGILSKYLFVYLVISLGMFFIYIFFKEKNIRTGSIVSVTILLAVLAPHLMWLVENDYIAVVYGLKRTGNTIGALNNVINPLIFLTKQIGILALFFLMLGLLVKKLKNKINFRDRKLIFLIFVTIVPIVLMFLTSLVMGAKIRTMWMTPFYLSSGVLAVYIFKNTIDLKKLRSFYFLFGFVFLISPTIYLYISLSQDNKRTDYPGKAIAKEIENRIGKESSLVSGDEWHAGNLSYHLSSRPKWVGYKKSFDDGICFPEFPPRNFGAGTSQKTKICLGK
jgi:4-amino-4-deoxy-L-arabinose transferase-like glycosyltransferase